MAAMVLPHIEPLLVRPSTSYMRRCSSETSSWVIRPFVALRLDGMLGMRSARCLAAGHFPLRASDLVIPRCPMHALFERLPRVDRGQLITTCIALPSALLLRSSHRNTLAS
eukprot:scaffold124484_cov29-Tisochrysis_lutea.AAC.6